MEMIIAAVYVFVRLLNWTEILVKPKNPLYFCKIA